MRGFRIFRDRTGFQAARDAGEGIHTRRPKRLLNPSESPEVSGINKDDGIIWTASRETVPFLHRLQAAFKFLPRYCVIVTWEVLENGSVFWGKKGTGNLNW
jgi:hypothetical protein